MKAEAEMGAMQPQVKGHQEPSKAGRGRGAVRASVALLTLWLQTSGLQNSGMMPFCCFKPSSLWPCALQPWQMTLPKERPNAAPMVTAPSLGSLEELCSVPVLLPSPLLTPSPILK